MGNEFQQIKQNFFSDLRKASTNRKSSLSYIKNELSRKPLVKQGIVQAIVIGGTNYVSALAKVTGKGKYKILKTEKGALPVFKGKQTFISFLNKNLDQDAQAIGLNFAFPLKPIIGTKHELDGILLRGTKEYTFNGLIGKSIGGIVKEVFFAKFNKQIPVTVANDTVCLALAGSGSENGAMVLGTGFNMSLKVSGKGKDFIVNLEAGNFDGFQPTETLKIIDQSSEHPGKMMLEKAVAGKYLVENFNEEAKLIKLKLPPLSSTEDLSKLSAISHMAESSRLPAGRILARSTLEKSASLIASAIAGIYEFRNRPAKLELITEGSLFWKGFMYKENVEKKLIQLGVPKNAIKFKFIEDSSLKGAIKLTLPNFPLNWQKIPLFQ